MFSLLLGFGWTFRLFWLFFISRRSVEFEYSLTNDVFDIDKIIAKRTRKRLISTSCKNFDDFGRYHPEEHTQKRYEKKYFACDSLKAKNLWYFVAKGSNEGNSLVVFNGSERLLEGIKEQIPRHMYQEFLAVHRNKSTKKTKYKALV